jgi:hypothetical protein
MRMLSGNSTEVSHNFGAGGAPSSTINGVNGTYALYADAYRAAAKELGIQPRQLQSVTWEEIRNMFPAEMKRIPKHVEAVDDIWNQYKEGKISLDKTHEMVQDYAKQAAAEMAANRRGGKISAHQLLKTLGQGALFTGAMAVLAGQSEGQERKKPMYVYGAKKPDGLLLPGNIDLNNRPTVHNVDGSVSSEYSTSFEDEKGHEVLVPTIVNGRFLTPDGKKPIEGSSEEKAMLQRAREYYQKTGEHMGVFDSSKHADIYADLVHSRGGKQ